VYRVGDPRELAAEGSVVCAVVDLARFVAIAVPERVTALLADLIEA
jgi:acyl-CoA thioesterase FadM